MKDLSQIKQKIEEYFNDMELVYTVEEEEDICMYQIGLALDVDTKISKIVLNIAIREDSIIVISRADIKADSQSKLRVSEFICRANWGMLNGNFEFDYDEGNIRYKIYINIEDGEISKDEFVFSVILSSKTPSNV